jgi:hypothetical protein
VNVAPKSREPRLPKLTRSANFCPFDLCKAHLIVNLSLKIDASQAVQSNLDLVKRCNPEGKEELVLPTGTIGRIHWFGG